MKEFKGVSPEKFLLGAILKENYRVIPEFKFAPERQFKADYFIPELNALVEYEGICDGADNGRKFSGKSRHTQITGYSKDCEKYNLAQTLGFTVLRYTALNYNQARADLKRLTANYSKIGGSK